MPSEFPRSPRLLKGALVVFEAVVPVPTNLIVFQYNPDTITRSFTPLGGGGAGAQQSRGGDTAPVLPPVEGFQLTVELDAADQLEQSNPLALGVGLHPTLAALELLLSPPSASLILNKVLSLAGPVRVVPVRVISVGVTEQAFDTLLNPIRAQVALGLRALTLRELEQAGPPFDVLGIVNLIAKEVLARSNLFNSAQQIGGMVSF
jgi:hypothetical protein